SPLYIPLSFVGATVQLGFASDAVHRRLGLLPAVVTTAALGALYVPLYEHLARAGGLWWYEGVSPAFGAAPRYVGVCAVLLAAAASLLARIAASRSLAWAAPAGLVLGAFIAGSMALGLALFP